MVGLRNMTHNVSNTSFVFFVPEIVIYIYIYRKVHKHGQGVHNGLLYYYEIPQLFFDPSCFASLVAYENARVGSLILS